MTNFNQTTLDSYAWICPVQYSITLELEEGAEASATEGETNEAAATSENAATETKDDNTASTEESKEKKPWFMERIDGLTRQKHELTAQNQTLAQQNTALRQTLESFLAQGATPAQAAAAAGQHAEALEEAGNAGDGRRAQQSPQGRLYTQAELEQIAAQRAAELAQQHVAQQADAAFNSRCNEIAAEGKREYSAAFDAALANLGAAGVMPSANVPMAQQAQQRQFLEAVVEFPEAAKLIHHLGNNPDEAIRIHNMRPAAMGAALARLAATVAAPRGASNAPPPVTTTRGTAAPAAPRDEELSMADWVAKREKELAERRR